MNQVEVRYEFDSDGGSVWVLVQNYDNDPDWLCVWSTAAGNLAERLDDTPEFRGRTSAGPSIPIVFSD